MKKSTLIGMLLGALALASCSSYGGAHGGTYYHSSASVMIGGPDYAYGYRSPIYRPGFYYYSGYYYPNVHPYYRNYHRHYQQWRHWTPRQAYPAKHWKAHKHDNKARGHKARAKYDRDRKAWRNNPPHPGRDNKRSWRPGDHDRKDWIRRDGNKHPKGQQQQRGRNR